MLKACVVGLGQAGSRFDEEPRPAVWSHVGAYLALPRRYRLAGGADIDPANRERFAGRCPHAETFADGAEMLARLKPDVVSVCTPPQGRAALVLRLLDAHRPKVLIAEKPLETDERARRAIVEACRRQGVVLIVNYNRRYGSLYRSAHAAIAAGRIGRPVSITVLAPNRLWSVGSHAVNLLLYLAGEAPASWRVLAIPALAERGEPAADLLCRFPSGLAGRVVTAGHGDMLVFEADVIGERARLLIREQDAKTYIAVFADSKEYLGYRVLGKPAVLHRAPVAESSFVALVREAADAAEGDGAVRSTGDDALASEALVEAVIGECKEQDAA